MKTSIKTSIITALTALYLATTGVSAFSQTESKSDSTAGTKKDSTKTESVVKFMPGYNGLENAASVIEPKGTYHLRTRALVNDAVKLGPVDLGYNSLHQMDNFDFSTYFSRNSVNIGLDGSPLRACAVIKVTSKGVVDVKYGLRNTNLVNLMGFDYGWIEATFNQNSGELTAFAGKNLGKKVSLEIYNQTTMPYSGGFDNYTEVQLNASITKNFAAFTRAEFDKGNLKEGTYLAGITVKL